MDHLVKTPLADLYRMENHTFEPSATKYFNQYHYFTYQPTVRVHYLIMTTTSLHWFNNRWIRQNK